VWDIILLNYLYILVYIGGDFLWNNYCKNAAFLNDIYTIMEKAAIASPLVKLLKLAFAN